MKSKDINRKWWKEIIVYQVYPRSFKDSNGDGIGDLRGITEKIDYIKSLGVDAVWLNPIYGSPNDDNGYDISDYTDIMKEYGSMQDFDDMQKAMHSKGLRLMMDLVINHTSDEHNWFQQSRSSRNNPYRDYYIWWPAEDGIPPARGSFFDKNYDAWRYDELTNAYYYHIFSYKQPDLNWDCKAMRQDIYRMIQFWFSKGVDCFRLDAISYISKDQTWPRFTPDELKKQYNDWPYYYALGPNLHNYLQEMNSEVFAPNNIVTVAEGSGVQIQHALDFVDEDRNELSMLYHFDGMDIGLKPNAWKVPDPNGIDLVKLKQVYTKWDAVFEEKGWGTIYLGNHDQPRMVTRWGNDADVFREVSAKMLFTFLLTMRATPFVYNGDELGMTNIYFDKIEDYNDIETRSRYAFAKAMGEDLNAFIEAQKRTGRDNSRTPFQWDATTNTGFTSGLPWLKVNENRDVINAEEQQQRPDSVLNYFKALVQLRKQHLVLVYGGYQLLDETHKNVYTYLRVLDDEKVLIVLNFFGEKVNYAVPANINSGTVLMDNYHSLKTIGSTIILQAYQALIVLVS